MALILASASPRRRELLGLLTENFTVCTADIDEGTFREATPAALAQRLAAEKCRAAQASLLAAGTADGTDCVIGCDTVVDADGAVLGKPGTPADADAMLRTLSGRTHLVHTGLAVRQGETELLRTVTAAVRFAPLTDAEIAAYIATDEPYDKAGGYGIQGRAARFITGIDGDYYTVMGLPVRTLYELLRQLNISL